MGNLPSCQLELDGFDVNAPTPVDKSQHDELEKGKKNGNVAFFLNKLTQVPVQLFTDVPQLSSLNLSVNFLRYLPPPLFEMQALETLDISCNEIEQISSNISRLQALRSLEMRHNEIAYLPAAFGQLTNLDKLNMEYNHLVELPNTFSGLVCLQQLKVAHNELLSLPEMSPNLTYLDASFNRLIEAPVSRGNFEYLQELHLHHNQIVDLSLLGQSLIHSKTKGNLTKVSLQCNRLNELPDVIGHLPNLTELDIRENQLTKVPNSLSQLSSLKKLLLASNKIARLPDDFFTADGLPNLVTLNLGDNQLETLPPGIQHLTALRELMLGGNKFTEVPAGITRATALTTLYLGWNRISRVDPSIGAMKKLSVLFLQGNRIKELPAELANCKALKKLYLANNAFTRFPEVIPDIRTLETVDLRMNGIKELAEDMRSMNFIEYIDLQNNPLPSVPKRDEEGAENGEERKERAVKLPKAWVDRQHLKHLSVVVGKGMHSGGGILVAEAEMQGKRWNMEDVIVTDCCFGGGGYFAVFDGHGGGQSSEYASKNHPAILKERLDAIKAQGVCHADEAETELVVNAIRESFAQCSAGMTTGIIRDSGTTSVLSLRWGDFLYTANVGDSRAVAWRGGKAIRLSVDHKPDLPSEEKRIRYLNGFVSASGRVFGTLGVSRAMGDLALQGYGVTADPYINVLPVDLSLQFVILACDGVWDVMSDETACELVASELEAKPRRSSSVSFSPSALSNSGSGSRVEGHEAMLEMEDSEDGTEGDEQKRVQEETEEEARLLRACMKVRDYAYLFGSEDNISVVVVKFSASGE
ncbi:PPM-type phosphatase domain-containing protein [Balamuthia mandrillaris]